LKLFKDTDFKIHPHSVRGDVIPACANDLDHFLNILFNQLDIDGIFTDIPDLAVKFLKKQNSLLR
jgi:glycerophosphoryl diester phosphodiesterase